MQFCYMRIEIAIKYEDLHDLNVDHFPHDFSLGAGAQRCFDHEKDDAFLCGIVQALRK